MIFFQRYKIAARIGMVVGIILIMMLVLAIVEVRGLNSIRNSMDEIVGRHYQRLQTAQDLRFLARHGAVLVRNVLMVNSIEEKKIEFERFEKGAQQYRQLLNQLTHQAQSEEEQEIIASIVDGSEITFQLWRTVTELEETEETLQGMRILQAEVRSHQWGLLDGLEALVQLEKKRAEEAMTRALENYNQTKSVMAMVNILAIGAGLFFVAAITASIVGPLHEISIKVDKIAAGDLSTRIELDQEDEVGQLADHINRMAEKLQTNEVELEEYRYNLEELIEWRTGEINDQRERFISVLIHDLKGPLVPIIGFSRLLMKKNDLSEEKIRKYAKAMYDSTSALSTTIENTSHNLRQKRLSYSFDRKPFDIEELLHSVSKSAQAGLLADDITLEINGQRVEEFRTSGDMLFAGDIGKLRSLIENIVGNAGKYATSRIDVRLGFKEGRLELIVDDDGCGVAEPFRKKIMEEYYQAPSSKEGTGIGLYSVKRIVDHYQGKITVGSSPSGGARFTVSLPLPDFGVEDNLEAITS